MHLRRVIICAVQAAAGGLGGRGEKREKKEAAEGGRKGRVEETGEEDGKGNNSEVDHAFCLEARLHTSKIVLRPIFLPLRATPLSFSPLALSSLPFSVALPLPRFSSFSLRFPSPSLALSLSRSPSETSRCVRTNTSEKSFTLTNTDARPTSHIQPHLSLSLSFSHSRFRSLLSLSLFSLASLLLSNLTPRKRAHNRVSALFNVGGLLLTNTRLKSSSGSFHQPLFLLPPPPSPLPLPPLSSS